LRLPGRGGGRDLRCRRSARCGPLAGRPRHRGDRALDLHCTGGSALSAARVLGDRSRQPRPPLDAGVPFFHRAPGGGTLRATRRAGLSRRPLRRGLRHLFAGGLFHPRNALVLSSRRLSLARDAGRSRRLRRVVAGARSVRREAEINSAKSVFRDLDKAWRATRTYGIENAVTRRFFEQLQTLMITHLEQWPVLAVIVDRAELRMYGESVYSSEDSLGESLAFR